MKLNPSDVALKLREMATQILSRPSAGHDLFIQAAELIEERDVRMLESKLIEHILDGEPGWQDAVAKQDGICPTMQSAIRLRERADVLEDAKTSLFQGQETARAKAQSLEQELARERAAGQEVHDFLVSCNPDNQHLSVLEAVIQQWGIENKLRKEVKEWKAICKNRDATVNQQGDEWVKLKTKIDSLNSAIADCYMISKRELSRLRGEVGGISGLKSKEAWTHVMRFCEATGARSDILRAAVPTEIQGG